MFFLPTMKNSIATRLLKLIFSLYLGIAIAVTLIHMISEYYHVRNSIIQELTIFENTFKRGIADALWELDQRELNSIIEGMVEMPSIVGVEVRDHKGEQRFGAFGIILNQEGQLTLVDQPGTQPSAVEKPLLTELFWHKFLITYTHETGQDVVGEATIYSSSSVIFEKVWLEFMFLIINAIIKTFALWIISLWVIRKVLNPPLSILTSAAEQLNLDNLAEDKINIQTKGHNELKVLEEAFNTMIERNHNLLQDLKRNEREYRTHLEQQVEIRTRELETSQKRFAGILDIAEDAIISIDEKHQIILFNQGAEKTFGYTAKEVLHESLDVLLPKTFREMHHQHVQQFHESNEQSRAMNQRNIITGLRKDGTEFFGEAAISQLDVQGEKIFTVMLRDISPRIEIEGKLRVAKDQAEKANRAKSEFLANMSHEIRTPMNAILGFTELLDSLITDQKQKSYFEAIKNGGKSLLTIINDILDLSKIEAGKMEIQYGPVNLKHLFQEIESILSLKISQKGLKFLIEIDPEVPQILMLDEIRLRQVLINIVGNAVKFTEKGSITLILKKESMSSDNSVDLSISVRDTGIGIPLEEQNRIFESFQQQEGQDTRKYGGTGLGLAISKGLIEMMDGKLVLQSNMADSANQSDQHSGGSTFTIFLYHIAIPASEVLPTTEKPQEVSNIEFEAARLLCVDDVESNRLLILEHFEGTEVRVISANNGQDALLLAEEHRPDIILMDIKMPIMGGYEATKILKSDEVLHKTPVIALTAAYTTREKEMMEQYGFDGYLRKPISRANLFQEVSRFLKFKQLEKQQEGMESILTPTHQLSPETLSNLPDILQYIDQDLMPQWESFQKKQPVKAVRQFGEKIKELGNTHDIDILRKFGDNLLKYAHNFDIDNMLGTLKLFPELRQTLQTFLEDDPNVPPSESSQPEKTRIPPQKELKELYHFAIRGNIRAIQKRIDVLEKESPQSTKFITEIRQLAKQFQVDAIQQFLEKLIDSESPNIP